MYYSIVFVHFRVYCKDSEVKKGHHTILYFYQKAYNLSEKMQTQERLLAVLK